ncbi:glycosyltransferase family 4 protein [Candidatus Nomurabacteria bacterium]|nr:glycosyltransferase family 4 protein [Candidatus Nomurabacteria bacterium]
MKNSKKILIFSVVFLPEFVGGAEIAIKEFTDRMDDGFVFDMITLRKNNSLFKKIGNINVYNVGWCTKNEIFFSFQKIIFPLLALFKAIQLNNKKRYDFTWSLMASYAGFAVLFFNFLYSKIPYILTIQEGKSVEIIKRKFFFIMPFYKLIFKRAKIVHVISNYLAFFAVEMGAKKIEIIPNGVDINIFSSDVKQNSDIVLNKKQDDIYLITTSRLVEKNNIANCILSLNYLSDNYKLLIIGSGFLENKLKKIVFDHKLNDRVFFIGDVEHKKIPSYFKYADIFIRPSFSEGLGNSFIEAMSFGLPIIGTKVGGIVDFLFDKKTGLFCDPFNPNDIAEKILMLQDLNLKNNLIKEAKDFVYENYKWENLVLKIKNLFN